MVPRPFAQIVGRVIECSHGRYLTQSRGALLRVRNVNYIFFKHRAVRKQLRLLHDQEPGRSQRSLIIVGLVSYVIGRANC